MLNEFRSFSDSIVTKIMIVILILSFVLWGIGDMVLKGAGSHSLAIVGKEQVSVDSYRRELAVESEQIRRQLGASYTPELLKRMNVPQFVLQRMVQESLLKQEAERMGFIPDDTSVALEIRKTPAFLNNSGVFDKARFENALRSQTMSEKSYVEKLRLQIATEKLLDALNIELPIDDGLLKTLQTAYYQGRNIILYRISGQDAGNVAAPTDEQLSAFHKEHAPEFTQPEYRTVSYLKFTASKAAPAAISEDAVEAYYNSHQDQFLLPERREVEQLLFDSEEKAAAALEQVKLGKSFKEVAIANDALNRNAVSLGLVDKRGMLENAADGVFRMKAGGYTQPVKSAFGWHIFRVVKIEPESTRPLAEVRQSIEAQLKQSANENALTDLMNQIEDALAGGSTLAEAAKAVGLTVEQAGTFNRDGKTPQGAAAAIPELDRFVDTAFKTEEKTESSVVTSKGGVYYVLRVDAVMPEKLRPLADVKAEVIKAYTRSQQEKKAAEIASKIEKDMADKKPAKDIVAAYKLSAATSGTVTRTSLNVNGTPLPSALTSKIFTVDIDGLTTPVRDKNGDYLIAQVSGLASAALPAKDDSATLRKELNQQMQEEIMTQYLRNLENRYPVEIHEKILNQILQDNSDVTR